MPPPDPGPLDGLSPPFHKPYPLSTSILLCSGPFTRTCKGILGFVKRSARASGATSGLLIIGGGAPFEAGVSSLLPPPPPPPELSFFLASTFSGSTSSGTSTGRNATLLLSPIEL